MNQTSKPIEEFFLESLLKICLVSIVIVMIADYYFTRFFVTRSLIVNSMVLFAIVSSLVLYRLGYFTVSVLWIGFVIIAAMFYQSINADSITTSSMAVVMVAGFGFSVLLKGRTSIICHAITFIGMAAVFAWLALHPTQYGKADAGDILVAGITYGVLYAVIAYSSWQLKHRYDEVIGQQSLTNLKLVEKTNEIETQNEELFQSQENLVKLNDHLETLVEARTSELKKQNERLIRYAYSNAHHLRGPVARLLGLIQLSRIDVNLDQVFLIREIEIQAFEIDEVVKSINRELEA
jgi:hypothetical protein